MKHGFLILAHKYNSAIVCLIETILSDARTHVYLHLDSNDTATTQPTLGTYLHITARASNA